MPGLIGCTKNYGTLKEVQAGRDAIQYSDHYIQDPLYQDEHILCLRTHLGIIGEKTTPVCLKDENVYCWLEGTFYNNKELQTHFKLQNSSGARILLEAYKKDILETVLAVVDGYFVAIIYDPFRKHLLLITDRYGMKKLYYMAKNGGLAWSSEVKGFLPFARFDKMIDKSSLSCFLELGYIMGEKTWFEDVQLVPAATILHCALEDQPCLTSVRYWTWTNIKPQHLTFAEALERLSHLLMYAVRGRIGHENHISLSLSGGLDSRLILCQLPDEVTCQTYTFSALESTELKIARQVTKATQTAHTLFEINQNNWLLSRLEGIWDADGMVNGFHLHAHHFHKKMAALGKICLNGFAGDLILGGSWTQKPDTRISKESAINHFDEFHPLDAIENPFYDFDKEDPYYFNNRLRKFTSAGVESIKYFETHLPFLDNNLIEFLYGLPDHFRLDHLLYTEVIRQFAPEWAGKIPWNKTGRPVVQGPHWLYLSQRLGYRLLNRLGYNFLAYADYRRWLKLERKRFAQCLLPKDAIYPEFIGYQKAEFLYNKLFSPKQLSTHYIGNLFTMEMYFQQVFNRKYRATGEFLRS